MANITVKSVLWAKMGSGLFSRLAQIHLIAIKNIPRRLCQTPL